MLRHSQIIDWSICVTFAPTWFCCVEMLSHTSHDKRSCLSSTRPTRVIQSREEQITMPKVKAWISVISTNWSPLSLLFLSYIQWRRRRLKMQTVMKSGFQFKHFPLSSLKTRWSVDCNWSFVFHLMQ